MSRLLTCPIRRLFPPFLILSLGVFGASMAYADEDEANEPQAQAGTISDDDGLTIATADEELKLHITGRFQLRYQFESARGEPDRSSIYFRRIQPNIEGTALSEDLTFRLRPDISRDASLRDAFVTYRFHDGFRLRAGQFNVPFNWERHLPPTRQQFVERSAANDEFQWTTGRDIGVMAHGDPTDQLRYGVGIFNGEGINQGQSDSTGHVLTGRVVFAALGSYQTSEVLVEPADELNLAIGVGGFAALDNSSRDWSFSPGFETIEADIFSATSDIHLRWSRLSAHVTGFFRHVEPGVSVPTTVQVPPGGVGPDEGPSSAQGLGWSAHVGTLLVPERLFAAVRYGQVDADLDSPQRLHEATAGLLIFHRAQHSKFHIESGLEFEESEAERFLARAQYQFLF